jgi:hypothetical protein
MKKLLAMNLCVILVLTMVACGASGGGNADGGLNGTFLDETGTVSLTFEGDKVILDFPTDDYSAEGTFETADGYLTLLFDEETGMDGEPQPYEMQDGNLILDGTLFVRQ